MAETELQKFLTSLYNSLSEAEVQAMIDGGKRLRNLLDRGDFPDDTITVPVFHASDVSIDLNVDLVSKEEKESGEVKVFVTGAGSGGGKEDFSSSMQLDLDVLETLVEEKPPLLFLDASDVITEGGSRFSVPVVAVTGDPGEGIRKGSFTIRVSDPVVIEKVVRSGNAEIETEHLSGQEKRVRVSNYNESGIINLVEVVCSSEPTSEERTAELDLETTDDGWIDQNGDVYEVASTEGARITLLPEHFTSLLAVENRSLESGEHGSIPVVAGNAGFPAGIEQGTIRFRGIDRDVLFMNDFRLSDSLEGKASAESLDGGTLLNVTLAKISAVEPDQVLGYIEVDAGRVKDKTDVTITCESDDFLDRKGDEIRIAQCEEGTVSVHPSGSYETGFNLQDCVIDFGGQAETTLVVEKDGLPNGLSDGRITVRNDSDILRFVDFEPTVKGARVSAELFKGGRVLQIQVEQYPPVEPGESIGKLVFRTEEVEEEEVVLSGQAEGLIDGEGNKLYIPFFRDATISTA